MIFIEIMAFKRKSQSQYSSWKSGTGISGKRRRRGGKQWRKKKSALSQKVAHLARDLKPETKFVAFYNNAGVDYHESYVHYVSQKFQ